MTRETSGLLLFLLIAASIGASAAQIGEVVINEIAWAGRPDAPHAEWIELLNTTGSPIDLGGWILTTSNGAPTVLLNGRIEPRVAGDPATGFFLLERGDDSSVPGIPADLIYEGALTDAGEVLYLRDPEGQLIDTANAPAEGESPPPDNAPPGWVAGSAAETHGTMERIDPLRPDASGNWATHNADCPPETPIGCGTPRFENSVFNLPPQPSMTFTPRIPGPGEPIRFSAASSTDSNDVISLYAWDLGDGALAQGQTASHAYIESGRFEVTLSVQDSKGEDVSVSHWIEVRAISPPLADFSLLPIPGGIERTGMKLEFIDESSQPSGEIVRREWRFGDGATAEGKRAMHEYSTPGPYEVILSIRDDRGQTAQASMDITIRSRQPVASFQIDPTHPDAGDPVMLGASSSHDPDGDVVSYLWDFDTDGEIDRTSTEPVIEHVFDEAGTLRATLVVQDESGETSLPFERFVVVNALPLPQFSISTRSPSELEEVTITDMSFDSDGEIEHWTWRFSDVDAPLEFTVQTSPIHAFRQSGQQTVQLTVRDDRGAEATAEMTVDVANLGPTASLSVEPGSEGETGAPFHFDASASLDPSPLGSIVTYDWDFDGDGIFDLQTTTPRQSHRYPEDGRPSVRVRVTDDAGATADSEPIRLHVRNRPPHVLSIDWDPSHPSDGQEVTFSAQVEDPDGTVERWAWTFNGGSGSDESEPTYAFDRDGTFTVRLVAFDNDGMPSPPMEVEVAVANTAPVADFSYTEVGEGLIQFDASLSYDPSPLGRIVHVAWDFGDGTECPGQPSGCGDQTRDAPLHRFLSPGAYTVKLFVIDDEGKIGRLSRQLVIE